MAFFEFVERIARLGDELGRLLAAASVEEQLHVYRDVVRPRLLRDELLRLVAWPPVLALLGVPLPQRQLVATHPAACRASSAPAWTG